MAKFAKILLKLSLLVMMAGIVFAVFVNAHMFKATQQSVVEPYEAIEAIQSGSVEKADCIVVLGASVFADGTPSAILRNRIDAAINLYNQGVSDTIIMSGYGIRGGYNEPYHMKQYAIEQGVDAQDIYCDMGGNHTYDSMWRTSFQFHADTCVVVSQEFHLARAVYDGNTQGMQTIGVISDHGTYEEQQWYEIREIFARTQDFLRTHIGILPFEAQEPITNECG